MSDDDFSLRRWLGYKKSFDFRKSPVLGAIVGRVLEVAALLGIGGVLLVVWLFAKTAVNFVPPEEDTSAEALRNLGFVLAALLGLPFLVWRSIVAHRQANTAEQSQITDRINKAVLGLGSEKIVKRVIETPLYQKDEKGDWLRDTDDHPIPAERPDGKPLIKREQFETTEPNIEVRVGAILSLERIARDSERDRLQILDILCAYIRENARFDETHGAAREDIQAALNQVAKNRDGSVSSYIPDFRSADLSMTRAVQADFRGAMLDGTTWAEANLHQSDFTTASSDRSCDFSGADLSYCRFNGASFSRLVLSAGTELVGVSFKDAILNHTSFPMSDMTNVDFRDATLFRCDFTDVLLFDCTFVGAVLEQIKFQRSGFYGCDLRGARAWDQRLFDEALGVSAGWGISYLPEGAVYPPHWLDLSNLDESEALDEFQRLHLQQAFLANMPSLLYQDQQTRGEP